MIWIPPITIVALPLLVRVALCAKLVWLICRTWERKAGRRKVCNCEGAATKGALVQQEQEMKLFVGVSRNDKISKGSAVPTPDGIAFVVAENEGVGALHDFAGEDEVGFALLDS